MSFGSPFLSLVDFCLCCLASTYGLWVKDGPKLGSDKLARQLKVSLRECKRRTIFEDEDFESTFISMKTCGCLCRVGEEKTPARHGQMGGRIHRWICARFKGRSKKNLVRLGW